MSTSGYYAYVASRDIACHDFPFYALIMAAMRQADTNNLRALVDAFPDTWDELKSRDNAPGGHLPGEAPADRTTH